MVVSIPLGAIQALGAVSQQEGDLGGVPGHALLVAAEALTAAPAIVYLALLLPTSHTLGMRARDIRLVERRTGRAPSPLAAALRAVVATAAAAATYLVVFYWTSFDRPDHLDSASTSALHVAYALAGLAAGSAALMVITPTHRNALDRVFGTAVIDGLEAVSPVLGPWGPLDTFDLANDRGRRRRLRATVAPD